MGNRHTSNGPVVVAPASGNTPPWSGSKSSPARHFVKASTTFGGGSPLKSAIAASKPRFRQKKWSKMRQRCASCANEDAVNVVQPVALSLAELNAHILRLGKSSNEVMITAYDESSFALSSSLPGLNLEQAQVPGSRGGGYGNLPSPTTSKTPVIALGSNGGSAGLMSTESWFTQTPGAGRGSGSGGSFRLHKVRSSPGKSPSASLKSHRIIRGSFSNTLRRLSSSNALDNLKLKNETARSDAWDSMCKFYKERYEEGDKKMVEMTAEMLTLQERLAVAEESHRTCLRQMTYFKNEYEKTTIAFKAYRDQAQDEELQRQNRTSAEISNPSLSRNGMLPFPDVPPLMLGAHSFEASSVPASPSFAGAGFFTTGSSGGALNKSYDLDTSTKSFSNPLPGQHNTSLSESELRLLKETHGLDPLLGQAINQTYLRNSLPSVVKAYEGLQRTAVVSVYVVSEVELENMRNSFVTQFLEPLNLLVQSERILQCLTCDLTQLTRLANKFIEAPNEAVFIVVFANEDGASPALMQLMQACHLCSPEDLAPPLNGRSRSTPKTTPRNEISRMLANTALKLITFCFPNIAAPPPATVPPMQIDELGDFKPVVQPADKLWFEEIIKHPMARCVRQLQNRNEQLKAVFSEIERFLVFELDLPLKVENGQFSRNASIRSSAKSTASAVSGVVSPEKEGCFSKTEETDDAGCGKDFGIFDKFTYHLRDVETRLYGQKMNCFEEVFCDARMDSVLSDAKHNYCHFQQYLERLQNHLQAPGPLSPMLVAGVAGSGMTSLMAFWVDWLKQKYTNEAVLLYHFVDRQCYWTTDPLFMISRFIRILAGRLGLYRTVRDEYLNPIASHVNYSRSYGSLDRNPASYRSLPADSTQLKHEFSKMLERASSSFPNGVVVVIDGIHRFRMKSHMNWLLDSLPFDCRVFVSARSQDCSDAWKSWPTVRLDPLKPEQISALLKLHEIASSINMNCTDIFSKVQESKGDSTAARAIQLSEDKVVAVLTSYLKSAIPCTLLFLTMFVQCVRIWPEKIDSLIQSGSLQQLLGFTISTVNHSGPSLKLRRLFKEVLITLACAYEGLSFLDLQLFIPDLDSKSWFWIEEKLMYFKLAKQCTGMTFIADAEVVKAVCHSYGLDSGKVQRSKRIEIALKLQDRGRHVMHRLQLLWLADEKRSSLKELLCQPGTVVDLLSHGRVHFFLALGEKCGFNPQALCQLCLMKTETSTSGSSCTDLELALACLLLGKMAVQMNVLSNTALLCFEKAQEICQVSLESSHPLSLVCEQMMAEVYTQSGKYRDAEVLLKKIITRYRNLFGEIHFKVLENKSALASLYRLQNRTYLAEPIESQVVEEIQRTCSVPSFGTFCGDSSAKYELNQSKSDTLAKLEQNTISSMGFSLSTESWSSLSGKEGSKRLEVLEAKAKNLDDSGSDGLMKAKILNDVGVIMMIKGSWDKAENIFRSSLNIRERIENERVPTDETANVLANLASVHKQKRNWSTAAELYERLFSMRKKLDGQNEELGSMGLDISISTAHIGSILAGIWMQLKRYADTISLLEPFQASLDKLEQLAAKESQRNLSSGEEDDDSSVYSPSLRVVYNLRAHCLSELASAYCRVGQHDKAEPLYQKALDIVNSFPLSDGSDSESPRIRSMVLKNYAKLQMEVGNKEKAAQLFLQSQFSLPYAPVKHSGENSARSSLVGISQSSQSIYYSDIMGHHPTYAHTAVSMATLPSMVAKRRSRALAMGLPPNDGRDRHSLASGTTLAGTSPYQTLQARREEQRRKRHASFSGCNA